MLTSILSLKDLLYPKICLSCQEPNFSLCAKCELIWLAQPRKTKVLDINHYFTQNYDEKSARIILASKESGNQIAINLLASSLARSIAFAVTESKFNKQIILVGIPSQKKIIRTRGRDHIRVLSAQVTKELFKIGLIARNLFILELTKKSMDQSTLNSMERDLNMKDAFIVHDLENSQDGIFLLDDLITTGASLREGVRAMAAAKITVNGIVTACAVGRNFLIR